MSFPETLLPEGGSKIKQEERENQKYTKEGIIEFVVVIILMRALGGGRESGEKGQVQLGN